MINYAKLCKTQFSIGSHSSSLTWYRTGFVKKNAKKTDILKLNYFGYTDTQFSNTHIYIYTLYTLYIYIHTCYIFVWFWDLPHHYGQIDACLFNRIGANSGRWGFRNATLLLGSLRSKGKLSLKIAKHGKG